MAQDVTMLVCDSADQAQEAAGFLTGLGFAVLVNEPAAHSLYDAASYDGGTAEHKDNKWVVVGRK